MTKDEALKKLNAEHDRLLGNLKSMESDCSRRQEKLAATAMAIGIKQAIMIVEQID